MERNAKYNVVFLDRDGTIIEDLGYLNDPKKVFFLKGVIKGLSDLVNSGFKLVVVTNQSGIARGIVKIKNFKLINKKIVDTLKKERVKIEKIFYCPHLPQENCSCRKPKTGLVKDFIKKVNRKNSFIIGDKVSDVQFGRNLKIKTIYLNYNSKNNDKNILADYIASDFSEAVKYILKG